MIDLTKWLPENELRPVAVAKGQQSTFDDAIEYRMDMQAILHAFHPQLQPIPMWSYGPTSPGAIIEAFVGKPVRVSWFNALGDSNLSTILDFGERWGMEEGHMLKKSHNVVHLHGARVPWTSDGFPEHIYHPKESHVFYYPNQQAAATLWYHDHAMDVTRLNVYAGLFGAYLLRTPEELEVLPAGELEIPLILQDKSFDDAGTKLHYTQSITTPEFVGDFPVVNGQIWPLKTVRPRVYRLRILNGSNTRFFNLSLVPEGGKKAKEMWVIGTEGGFLPKPVKMNTALLIAPGERLDVLLDLRGCTGKGFILRNDAPAPYSGDPRDPHFASNDPKNPYGPLDPSKPCAELLKIAVEGNEEKGDEKFAPSTIKLPKRVDPLVAPKIPARKDFQKFHDAIAPMPIELTEVDLVTADGVPFKLRRFKLEEYQLEMSTQPGKQAPSVQINDKSWMTADPVVTKQNALEVWEFVNTTPDTHPMHIHLIQFQVMNRPWLKIDDDPARMSLLLPEPKKASYTGEHAVVEEFEKGWKDTVRCNPQQSTRVLAQFDGASGDYVYHCHILEHEDMGMMYRLNVEPA